MIDHTDTITPDMFPATDTTDTEPGSQRALMAELIQRFDALIESTGKSRSFEFVQARLRFTEACLWLKAGLESND